MSKLARKRGSLVEGVQTGKSKLSTVNWGAKSGPKLRKSPTDLSGVLLDAAV